MAVEHHDYGFGYRSFPAFFVNAEDLFNADISDSQGGECEHDCFFHDAEQYSPVEVHRRLKRPIHVRV